MHIRRATLFTRQVCILLASIATMYAGEPSWRFQLERYPDNLWHVVAVSRDVCWVLGIRGSVLRTADGGKTWLPAQGSAFRGRTPSALAAFDADEAVVGVSTFDPWGTEAFAPDDTSWIYLTTNGGRSWHDVFRQPGGFFNGIHRLGGQRAICLGNPVDGRWTILISSDRGASWVPAEGSPPHAGPESGSLGSSATRGERHIWFGAAEEESASRTSRIYRSTDGGAHWSFSILPFPSPHTLDFRDSLVGIVATTRRNIARTADGGVTWGVVTLPFDEGSGDVSASPDGRLWLTQHRSVLCSTDAGLTWNRLWTAHPSHKIAMKFDLVMEGDSVFGWATTWAGGIIRYEDQAHGTR